MPTQNPAPVTPVVAREAPTAAQMLDAARAQRSELRSQLDRQQDIRQELRREIDRINPGSPERTGLETRLRDVDARIADLDKQIATADARVAQAAAVPGAIVPPPPRPQIVRNGPPDEAWMLGGMAIIFVFMPIALAFARRIWRRGAAAITSIPAELSDRLSRLEQAVDAVAVELERVGEGQRYVTRLFSEQGPRALGAGAAEPLEARQREAVRQQRP